MNEMSFDSVFRAAFGKAGDANFQPYAYQCRLACGEPPEAANADLDNPDEATRDWLSRPDPGGCRSRLIDIPTGLGKTVAVVLAWLWNRVIRPPLPVRPSPQGEGGSTIDYTWPRRLVYCLPMRTLVEQTERETREWVRRLAESFPENEELKWLAAHSPVILMGGEEPDDARREWDIHPERPAILIGTQDMLLSRALNRGYGMSRYRWPMHFGLLNNDALWVMDETQLMGPGLATSIQLDAFRNALWMVEKRCVTWWMSATGSTASFDSTDRKALELGPPSVLTLSEEENASLTESGRLRAEKRVAFSKVPPKLTARDGSGILDRHQAGRISLLVVNTVPMALRWHEEISAHIAKPAPRGRQKLPQPELLLLHGRFRPPDRARQLARLNAFIEAQPADGSPVANHPGIIIVSTQVLEAGFDLSSVRLWSEIAPWPSVIQRLGRLNREGRQPDAQAVFWMPKMEEAENGKDAPNTRRIGPYATADLKLAQELIDELSRRIAASATYRAALEAVLASPKSENALEPAPTSFIRPDDVHGLFANEPDLAGGFTNIAPFVRDEDRNADLLLYWREFTGDPGSSPSCDADASREELVSVPFYELQKFLRAMKQPVFLWEEEAERWVKLSAAEVVPGMELLLPCSTGGYRDDLGWTGRRDPERLTTPITPLARPRNGLRRDAESDVGWQSLRQHTAAVARACAALGERLDFPQELREVFRIAAEWHDVGKAHSRWQTPLRRSAAEPWGKFENVSPFRPGFRHEAFSLLAAWEAWQGKHDGLSALALFLIATHHGKVRTVLRSTTTNGDYFGLHETDKPLRLAGGEEVPASTRLKNFTGAGEIDWERKVFTPREPSWTAVVSELLGPAWRDDPETVSAIPQTEPRSLGPFHLAWLETIFRAADARASIGEFANL